MKLFGLTPEQIQQRTDTTDLRSTKTTASSMFYGALSFAIVSTLAYSLWAFRLVRGEALLFATIAIVYLGLSGLALSRLLIIPRSLFRFMGLFALSFLIYAIAWCLFWFGLGGQYHADLFGCRGRPGRRHGCLAGRGSRSSGSSRRPVWSRGSCRGGTAGWLRAT